MTAFLRKYGVDSTDATAVYVPMITAGANDFNTTWVPAAGDVIVELDGVSLGNILTLPVSAGKFWKFVFDSTELAGKQLAVSIVDQGTKAVEDQAFLVETYGDANAMYPDDLSVASTADASSLRAAIGLASANLDTQLDALPTSVEIADALLIRNQKGGANSAPTVSDALAGGLFLLSINTGTGVLTVKHGDGTTAYTRTLTRAALDAIVAAV